VILLKHGWLLFNELIFTVDFVHLRLLPFIF